MGVKLGSLTLRGNMVLREVLGFMSDNVAEELHSDFYFIFTTYPILFG
jgi:hypothetical protein